MIKQRRLHIRILICLLPMTIILGLILGFNLSKPRQKEVSKQSFSEFSNELFVDIVSSDSLILNFTLSNPEQYNITKFPSTFGHIPLSADDTIYSEANTILEKLSEYEYNALTIDEQYAYDTISWYYNNVINSEDYLYYTEYLSPSDGIQIQLPILLSEYHFNSKKDIDNYLSLLPDIERYFNDICTFEKAKAKAGLFMSRSSANKVVTQCNNILASLETSLFVTAFNNNIESLEGITQNDIYAYEKQNLEIVNNHVKNAYSKLATTISSLNTSNMNTGCMFDYVNGRDYYELNLNQTTGSNRSIKNVISILENTITLNNSQLLNLIVNNNNIQFIDLTTNYGIDNADEIISSLKQKMEKYFPKINSVNYTIKTVPEELTDYLNPAFYIVSQIDNYKHNTIYINNVAQYSGTPLFTNIAHETYPGHLYQNAYFCQNNTLPIRNIIKNTGYIEGWASYITNLSYGYTGMESAQVQISRYNDAIVLCLSARADIGVHYEGWTKTDISEYFSENNCPLNEAAINSLYNIIIDDPGDYLSYAIGYIEITRLLNDAKDNMQDNFSLKKFHTFLLDAGPAPFNSIKSHMEKELY